MTKKNEIQSEQEVMRYFYDNTKIRTTPAQAKKTVVTARQLLDAGYTKEEIKGAIDYLIKNPPPKGFFSLGFLNYTMNEVLDKIKVQEFKEKQIEQTTFDIDNTNTNQDNKEKFNKMKNTKIKGMGRF